jgi:hypothetical protein
MISPDISERYVKDIFVGLMNLKILNLLDFSNNTLLYMLQFRSSNTP